MFSHNNILFPDERLLLFEYGCLIFYESLAVSSLWVLAAKRLIDLSYEALQTGNYSQMLLWAFPDRAHFLKHTQIIVQRKIHVHLNNPSKKITIFFTFSVGWNILLDLKSTHILFTLAFYFEIFSCWIPRSLVILCLETSQLFHQIRCLFMSVSVSLLKDRCSWEDEPWCALISKKAQSSTVTSQLLSKTSHDSRPRHPPEAPLNAAVEPSPEGLYPQMIKKVNYWFVYRALKTQSALLNREHIKGEYC